MADKVSNDFFSKHRGLTYFVGGLALAIASSQIYVHSNQPAVRFFTGAMDIGGVIIACWGICIGVRWLFVSIKSK